MAIATATSLDVHMGGKLLFAGVSFKLEPRERMTLSGRNGAGKSTLLRLLAGELAPTQAASSCRKGRASPCTTSGRRAQTEISLGEYVFSGRAEMLADRGRAGATRGGDVGRARPARTR